MRRCRDILPVLTAGALASLGAAVQVGAQEDRPAGSYRIGPRDQIQIRVEEAEDLSAEVEVGDDGTISLPQVGTVAAQGLTEAELAARLRVLLESRVLRRATVSVSVNSFRSRPVSILGAVASPGNHNVPARATLLEVLMEAGGVSEDHGREIVVRRRATNGLSDELRIAVADLIEAGSPKVNIPIFAGDLIHVPARRKLTIHLIGEVTTRGEMTFEADQSATLLTAIARAGGLTEKASNKIRLQRRSSSGERREMVVDFRRILNNKEPDVTLEDGDLIIVKESFF